MSAGNRLRLSGLLIAAVLLFSYLPTAAATPRSPSSYQRAIQSSAVVINEFLASNQNGLTDEDGDHSDWLELYNSGAVAIDLIGWSLTMRMAEKKIRRNISGAEPEFSTYRSAQGDVIYYER